MIKVKFIVFASQGWVSVELVPGQCQTKVKIHDLASVEKKFSVRRMKLLEAGRTTFVELGPQRKKFCLNQKLRAALDLNFDPAGLKCDLNFWGVPKKFGLNLPKALGMKKLDQDGQGLTEYITLLVLVALVAVGAAKTLGTTVKEKFKLPGDTSIRTLISMTSNKRLRQI